MPKDFRPKREIDFHGLSLEVETDQGEVRHWKDEHTGETGSTKFLVPYGYLKNSVYSGDGKVDVFVGPDEDAKEVYVVHQMKKPDFKEFDEYKCMVNFSSEEEAKNTYLKHYNSPKFLGKVETISIDEFKDRFMKKAMGSEGPIQGQQMPQAPGFGGMQFEPVTDVNYIEGVNYWLGKSGNLSDKELQQLIEEIWGAGYSYRGSPIELVKAELLGWLLDQKELLELIVNPPIPEQLQLQSSPDSSQGSGNGPSLEGDQSNGGSYSEEVSPSL